MTSLAATNNNIRAAPLRMPLQMVQPLLLLLLVLACAPPAAAAAFTLRKPSSGTHPLKSTSTLSLPPPPLLPLLTFQQHSFSLPPPINGIIHNNDDIARAVRPTTTTTTTTRARRSRPPTTRATRTRTTTATLVRVQRRLIQQRESGWDHGAWKKGFHNVATESCYVFGEDEDDDDDGTTTTKTKPTLFPLDLQGTLFQNGHAKFQIGSEHILHPFDADGMISAVTFCNGTAWFRNRFVHTPEYLAERRAQKILYRGVFGTMRAGGQWWRNMLDTTVKKVANTGVLFAGAGGAGDGQKKDRLFALWENFRPYEMDPATLETRDYRTLDGSLGAAERYSAHYTVDPATGHICNFGIAPPDARGGWTGLNQRHTTALLIRARPAPQPRVQEGRGAARLWLRARHGADGRVRVLPCRPPLGFNALPLLLGTRGAGECIAGDPHATHGRLVLVPRGTGTASPSSSRSADDAVVSIDNSPLLCLPPRQRPPGRRPPPPRRLHVRFGHTVGRFARGLPAPARVGDARHCQRLSRLPLDPHHRQHRNANLLSRRGP